MKVAVTDANIFIDLIKLHLVGFLFSIDIEIYTTREVVDQLNSGQFEKIDPLIQASVLRVHSFSSEEVLEVVQMEAPKALEFPDKTVVFLAKKMGTMVLTGDGPVRKFCQQSTLEVRGIIWLFDIFLEKGLISHPLAIEKMRQLLSFNDRLPKDDCLCRIDKWAKEK